jgi:hypothetical protein
MTAATRCKRWSAVARSGSNGLEPSKTAMAALSPSPFRAMPGNPCSKSCWRRVKARVSARIGDKACAEALLATERAAREARRGLWADPNFAPLRAENLIRLQSERGHFTLVEGKVLSVRESGATIYVNFGRRWTRDFSVTIFRRHQRAFTAAGVEPKRLEGRRIRVRGWI